MTRLELDFGLFEPRCGDRWRHSERRMIRLLEEIADENALILRCGSIPLIYNARGIRWRAEPEGVESFVTLLTVLRKRHGDCAHLAAWRIAELRVIFNEPAQFVLDRFQIPPTPDHPKPRTIYHVRVLRMMRGIGGMWYPWAIEDPSRILGMPSSAEEAKALARAS